MTTMQFDFPSLRLVPQLRSLWRQAFGDGDVFLDAFFSLCFSPKRSRCILRNGEVVSALYWFDFTCRDQKMAYLYAVATREDCRHQGLCRALLADTREVLEAQGYSAALLCPENEGLARMYAGQGYLPVCKIAEVTRVAGERPVSLRRVSPEEYASSRRRFLPAGGAQPEECFWRLLAREAELFVGKDFLLAARRQDDTLLAVELLGNSEAAPGILAALSCRDGTFRMPGNEKDFAMFLPLIPDTRPPVYFGLALD